MKDLPGLSLEKGLIAALQLNTLIRTTEDFKEGNFQFPGEKTGANGSGGKMSGRICYRTRDTSRMSRHQSWNVTGRRAL